MGHHHATDDYEWLYGDHDWSVKKLPNGLNFLVYALYSKKESAGVVVLVLISVLSLLAVLGLLGAIFMSTFRGHGAAGEHLFVRTQVSNYFTLLLFAHVLQSIASIMNAKWVAEQGVYYGDFCRVQGSLKMVADLSIAIWSLFAAAHTFFLVFFKLELHKVFAFFSVILGWGLVTAASIGGVLSVDRKKRGPFYAIAGLWCWVAEGYPGLRISNDYLILFLSGVLSAIFYVLVWLRTRGNIARINGRLRFQKKPQTELWRQSDLENGNGKVAAGRLLLYPIFYFLTLLPIAIVRFSTMNGHRASLEATIFADSVYQLSGLFHVIIFFATRRVLSPQGQVKWKNGDTRSSGINVQLPGSPDSTEKGPLPGDLGIYFVEEPAMMKTAAWDDNFNIAAHPPTPGIPRSPYALPSARPGVASGFEEAQQQVLTEKPPFTPRPFRLSMNISDAPASPIAPRSPMNEEPPRQPFTPRPLRLSKGATTPGPPHSPPGLENPHPPVTPGGGQEVPREPAPLKTFRLSSVPLGRKNSKKPAQRRGGSLGYVSADEVQAKRGHATSNSVPEATIHESPEGSPIYAPKPIVAVPVLPLSLIPGGMPKSAFVAAEDETTRERGRPGFDHHDSGAWSPSRDAARSRAPSMARSYAPSPAGSIGIASASSASSDARTPMSDTIVMMGPLSAMSRAGSESDYEEPEFEMMH